MRRRSTLQGPGLDSQVAHSRSGNDAPVQLRSVGIEAIDDVLDEAVGRGTGPTRSSAAPRARPATPS